MTALRYLSGGESHGPSLTAIIEGMPAGIMLDAQRINQQLQRRQGGVGRGGRMVIEKDPVEILSGVRRGPDLGRPNTLRISNRDWEKWQEINAAGPTARLTERVVTQPRPGHADLAGALKYRQSDIRNILERSSARETAVRVAVGAVAQEFLRAFAIRVQGYVSALGPVKTRLKPRIYPESLFETPLYCPSVKATQEMLRAIERAREKGDTLGGVVTVVAEGLPVGLGAHVQWDRRLDGRLAQALMSIQAIKGVEIGLGFGAAALPGSRTHDEITYTAGQGFYHRSNKAGGIEGGMTNGELLVLKAAMKPIPTLAQPLSSIDLATKEIIQAAYERSDICAVSAAAIVAQGAVAWTLAGALAEKFGGDHLTESQDNYRSYLDYLQQR